MSNGHEIAAREARAGNAKAKAGLVALERAFLACRGERERIEQTQRALVEQGLRETRDRNQLALARAFQVAESTLAFVFAHYPEFAAMKARDRRGRDAAGDTSQEGDASAERGERDGAAGAG